MRRARPAVPERLVVEITGGRCIAFVGAGFSAAAELPSWPQLITSLSTLPGVSQALRRTVADRVALGTAGALDAAAQMLQDTLGRETVRRHLETLLARPRLSKEMRRRLELLAGIPFRAILTTNYDGTLRGIAPDADAYRTVLRPPAPAWRSAAYWSPEESAPIIKLHGDVGRPEAENPLVLTRRDYRRHLHQNPAYATFVRALMATSTILYLGFSFQDAYLNELRSETLALLGHEPGAAPVAWSVVNDVPDVIVQHFRDNEGIEMLSYDTSQQKDFSGFDDWLEAIYAATSPVVRFGHYLRERRILWLDPRPESYAEARTFFDRATRAAGPGGHAVVEVPSADTALRRIAGGRERFDLVITHWGDGDAVDDAGVACPTAVKLLRSLRRRDVEVPVVVFSRDTEVPRRKAMALGLGAQGYCVSFQALFRTIESIFTPESETGAH